MSDDLKDLRKQLRALKAKIRDQKKKGQEWFDSQISKKDIVDANDINALALAMENAGLTLSFIDPPTVLVRKKLISAVKKNLRQRGFLTDPGQRGFGGRTTLSRCRLRDMTPDQIEDHLTLCFTGAKIDYNSGETKAELYCKIYPEHKERIFLFLEELMKKLA